jgi:hypothetical protein
LRTQGRVSCKLSAANARQFRSQEAGGAMGWCDWRRYLETHQACLNSLRARATRSVPPRFRHAPVGECAFLRGSAGERFAPAEREGAVAPGTLTLTIPFWKLCRATPLTPDERPPPGKLGPSTPLLPKGKPRRGKRGFQQRTASGGIGGILGAVLQALVARASGGVQSGSAGVAAARQRR